jgi:hypothetical protein
VKARVSTCAIIQPILRIRQNVKGGAVVPQTVGTVPVSTRSISATIHWTKYAREPSRSVGSPYRAAPGDIENGESCKPIVKQFVDQN